MVRLESLPVDELPGVVQLDPPRTSRRGIRRPLAGSNLIERELAPAHDPSRLPEPGIAVGANAGVREDPWKFGAQEPDDVVRLTTSFEDHLCARRWIERCLEVRDVGEHDGLPGEVHQEAVV